MSRHSLSASLCAVAFTSLPLAAQYAYRMTDLGVLPGSTGSIARGISPEGRRIVGWSGREAFVWEEGVGMRALPKLAGFTEAAAYDVDSQGRVVGQLGIAGTAVMWHPNGTITQLGTLSGTRNAFAYGINDLGQVAGYSDTLPNTTLRHAYLWQAGSMVDLTPGALETYAYDVNQFGQVAGHATTAFRYTPGSGVQWLGTVPGYGFSTGFAINDAGQVAGNVTNPSGSSQRIVRYSDGIGWEVLGGTGDENHASGINSFGQVVGEAITGTGGHRAFVYTDGLGVQSVSQLVHPAANSFFAQAHSINDRGQISGHRFDNNLSGWRAFRLDPQYVSVYGQGCAGGNGHVPKLLVAGLPKAGERVVVLLAEGAPSSNAVVFFSASSAATPLGFGCTAHVAFPAFASATVTLDAIGQGRLVLALPAGLPAAAVHVQCAVLDPSAPNGGFSASNGVSVQTL